MTAVAPVFVTVERRPGDRLPRHVAGARKFASTRSDSCGARGGATRPRYRPLSAADLKDFRVTMTIVESQSSISAADINALLPEDGLVLQCGSRFGIVLPWEGKDARVRLGWAYQKAGVARGASCRLFRLKARRFRG
jgi:AMMECR1 domain-containing protein